MTPSAASLAAVLGLPAPARDFPLARLSIDSRSLPPGSAFLALDGRHHRGVEFLPAAAAAGAVGAIVGREALPPEALHQNAPPDLPLLLVPDPVAALVALGQLKRAASRARFIGITGSNGKTSTKEMLAFVLAGVGRTSATRGNLNNHLGVPLTLANLAGDEDFVVIEMGANHPGEIAPLAAQVRPELGLVTTVAPAHLEGFGSLQGVIETKEALLDAASRIVLSWELPAAALNRWRSRYRAKLAYSYGFDRHADIHWLGGDAQRFRARDRHQTIAIDWACYGRHNQLNGLAVIALVEALGLDGQIAGRLRDFQMSSGGRFAAKRFGCHWLIDDSYNANPASFAAALQTLAGFAAAERVVYAGAMGELGPDSAAQHRLMADLAASLGLTLIPVGTDAYGRPGLSKAAAAADLRARLQSSRPSALLLKGSRSAALETLLADLPLPPH